MAPHSLVLLGASGGVVLGPITDVHLHENNVLECAIRLTVAFTTEPVTGGLTGGHRDRATPVSAVDWASVRALVPAVAQRDE